MAYTGPRILNVDDEGYPIQPYGFKSNPYSILDEADIAFLLIQLILILKNDS